MWNSRNWIRCSLQIDWAATGYFLPDEPVEFEGCPLSGQATANVAYDQTLVVAVGANTCTGSDVIGDPGDIQHAISWTYTSAQPPTASFNTVDPVTITGLLSGAVAVITPDCITDATDTKYTYINSPVSRGDWDGIGPQIAFIIGPNEWRIEAWRAIYINRDPGLPRFVQNEPCTIVQAPP